MQKLIYLALLVGGIVITVYGMNAAGPVAADFFQFLGGLFRETATWLLIFGAAAAAIGAVGLLRRSKTM